MKINARLLRFNLTMLMRWDMKKLIKKYNPKKLSATQKKQIKKYYKEKGYKNVRTHWHRYYIANNNKFSVKYISEDIFHPIISNAVNQMKQWPALLDKNLYETIFSGFKQPVSVIKNINGFYYKEGELISKDEAIEECLKANGKLVIKPSIESGGGQNVVGFFIKNNITTHNNLSIEDLLDSYKKDFIVQKVVLQHSELKSLNETSLNTLRVITYFRKKESHVLSALIRVGKVGMFVDSQSLGGNVCGVNDDGSLHKYGYQYSGEPIDVTDSNVKFIGNKIPNYDKVTKMIKELHLKIPYFRIVSWDIAIDNVGDPVLIEYNTYRQGIKIHQLANGPLFGEFTDELLEIGRLYKTK
jgi:hypothetical protein